MMQRVYLWLFIWSKQKHELKDTHPHIHCSIIYNSQDIET